ncbi:MAG: 3-phosphoshikimate 1-carboxyvinyltransferase [Candidatus Gastranaerophilales bacterium]|nr:3-phosphoshikimate 1-carboxyvinyltransferase [Candidatus Gastranaerophilales bacterium]
MDNFISKENITSLSGEIIIPPDKSMSHRAIIFGALTKGKVKISNLSLGQDCLNTLKIFEQLGVKVEFLSKRDLILDSSNGFKTGDFTFDCGNSGTTTRLLAGLFSWQNFNSKLIGDKSLSKRPMKRIIEPLSLMGAEIKSNENKLPLEIKGKDLSGIEYFSKIASAQVKSAILLAGLGAKNKTRTYEPTLSRNHSEIMLEYLGAKITSGKDEKGYFAQIEKSNLTPKDIEIVGDISSAAFFMVMGAIVPNSSILIKNVGINPTRDGIIEVFKQSEIDFEILNEKYVSNELCADIKVNYTPNIKPFEIKGDIIPRLIDEIPILAVLATQAQGQSTVSNAQDLRNKESDRIKTIVDALLSLDVDIKEKEDGFIINGKKEFDKEVELETHLDHRLAMSYFVMSLINKKPMKIKGFDCINTSFPEFLDLAKQIGYGE